MTREPTTTTLDAAISAMLDERAGRADGVGLRGDILSATAAQPQVRGWRLSLPSVFPAGLARVVILAILAVALGVAGLVAIGALSDEPVPTGRTTNFIRPFAYTTPYDPTIRMMAIERDVIGESQARTCPTARTWLIPPEVREPPVWRWARLKRPGATVDPGDSCSAARPRTSS